jgi:hypothetical protein
MLRRQSMLRCILHFPRMFPGNANHVQAASGFEALQMQHKKPWSVHPAPHLLQNKSAIAFNVLRRSGERTIRDAPTGYLPVQYGNYSRTFAASLPKGNETICCVRRRLPSAETTSFRACDEDDLKEENDRGNDAHSADWLWRTAPSRVAIAR